MRMYQLFISAILMSFMGIAWAERTEVDMNAGATAMQISLQKEIYGIVLSDTQEAQNGYKDQGIMYQAPGLAKYQAIMQSICQHDGEAVCPPVYFTKRVEQGIAAMYPNGVLVLNDDMIKRITHDEAVFVLAHEYAHYKFAHTKQRMLVIAKSVVDNAYMIKEPEHALAYAGFFLGVKDAHYAYENQADAYGFDYIKAMGIQIDCNAMMQRIAGDEKVSTDKHSSISERCAAYRH